MDAALKRDAVVEEATLGTTPANPAFRNVRSISISGTATRPNVRSPERVNHGQATNMVQGKSHYPFVIETPYVRDAAGDILWASLCHGAFAANVLKLGQTAAGFTLEQKYEGGTTDFYRRLTGCIVESLRVAFRNDGSGGRMTWTGRARAEATAAAAIAGATYAEPSPGNDPISDNEILVNDLFTIASPVVTGFDLQISNNLYERYGFGSPDPNGHGRGQWDVEGTVMFYFAAATNYTDFTTRKSGRVLDLTLGSVTNQKDRLVMSNCDAWDPSIADPGQVGDHEETLRFLAKYHSGDASAFKLTRAVA